MNKKYMLKTYYNQFRSQAETYCTDYYIMVLLRIFWARLIGKEYYLIKR